MVRAKAYEGSFSIVSGMYPLMAWTAQQHKVFRIESEVRELCPASDVVDFKCLVASLMYRSASLTRSLISRPDRGTYTLPGDGSPEGTLLFGDPATPLVVVRARVEVISTPR